MVEPWKIDKHLTKNYKYFYSKESIRIKGQPEKNVYYTYNVVFVVLLCHEYLQINKKN